MSIAPVPAASPDDAPAPLARLDSDMAHMLQLLAASGARPLSVLTVEDARAQPDLAAIARRFGSVDHNVDCREVTVPAGQNTLEARLYRPLAALDSELPIVVYFGDGLFSVANLDAADDTCRGLARRIGAVVLSVAVRQAPEHRFPAQEADAMAVWRHLPEILGELRADSSRRAIVGEGAGAALALHVALECIKLDLQGPLHLGLVVPWSQFGMDLPEEAPAGVPGFLSVADLVWAARKLVRKRVDLKDPRLNPGARLDVAALPPTTIILAAEDPLHEDGEQLARTLRSQGVWVDAVTYPGVVHDFFGLSRVVNRAILAQGKLALNLRVALEAALARRLRQF